MANLPSDEARRIAHDILAIGRTRNCTPETFLIQKQEAAESLFLLARRLERRGV